LPFAIAAAVSSVAALMPFCSFEAHFCTTSRCVTHITLADDSLRKTRTLAYQDRNVAKGISPLHAMPLLSYHQSLDAQGKLPKFPPFHTLTKSDLSASSLRWRQRMGETQP
jgi:hypothetical protein